MRVYINGEIVAQGVTSVFFEEFGLISGDVKRIGNNQGLTEPANAIIDEVRIWKRALSAEEVYERAGTSSQINLNLYEEFELIGYWKLDCSYINAVTGEDGTNYGSTFGNQHCDYSTCNQSIYDYECFQEDCNSCDPPEGCMYETACNYDPLVCDDDGSCHPYLFQQQ